MKSSHIVVTFNCSDKRAIYDFVILVCACFIVTLGMVTAAWSADAAERSDENWTSRESYLSGAFVDQRHLSEFPPKGVETRSPSAIPFKQDDHIAQQSVWTSAFFMLVIALSAWFVYRFQRTRTKVSSVSKRSWFPVSLQTDDKTPRDVDAIPVLRYRERVDTQTTLNVIEWRGAQYLVLSTPAGACLVATHILDKYQEPRAPDPQQS